MKKIMSQGTELLDKRTVPLSPKKDKVTSRILVITATVLIIIVALIILIKYASPIERNVELELITVINIEGEDQQLVNPGIWYGVYGAYGGSLASNEFHPDFIDKWIAPDLENFSYIISFGQRVESLSYNVWDNIESPHRGNVRKGHIILSDEFDGWSIYIYRIPKMRIDS